MVGIAISVLALILILGLIYLAGPQLNIPQNYLNIIALVVLMAFVLIVLVYSFGGDARVIRP